MTELIAIRPEDIGRGKATIYSDHIINKMMRVEELEVVGICNAISLACSAVAMSSSVARVYIKEACLDYIEVPILGKMSAIFFTLGGEPTIDWESEKAKLEKNMKLDFEPDGQLIIISKKSTG
ncbi:MAG: hypothetical protein AOA66_0347 [Candidatus Bathyarchaeota archaeon BA2]|nr:MAG: hypothetical protein AOA66_0347 [Candidatus Bathyarchaeota archaeon BA2]